MRHPRARKAVLATALGVALALLSMVHGQQVHRNSFETQDIGWIKGTADAPFKEAVHDMTDTTAHTGQHAEHIQLTTEQGNYVHYYYPTGRAPITEDLSVTLWIKANRPGIQLLARLVLPKERNPNNLDEPLTTLLRGETYQTVSRWQRLELRRPVRLAKEQQQLMRAELKRDVDFTDAYIDRFVLNLYGGPGLTEVWIDDLEVGPVLENTPFMTTSRPVEPTKPLTPLPEPRLPARAAVVEFKDHLLVNGKRFFFRGIRHSDTPLKALRDAGFNTVWFDYTTTPAVMDEAINLGFWLVPSLPVVAEEPRLSSTQGLIREVARFQERDAVLFWDLGGGLSEEQSVLVARAGQCVHAADPQRPLGADVWDGFRPYSRNLDLVGVHRWPLMTGLELLQYRDWLNQRRLLARPGTFMWTWVQTHLPDWYTELIHGHTGNVGFDEPIGPQPEQIRLLTYVALASGSRGLAFWSDRFLADSHQGRDRLLALALLNQEMRMLEPMLLTAQSPTWIDSTVPDVKVAILRTDYGVLALPMWLGKGAQFVPGQAAKANLALVIPQVPLGTQAWEITPAHVRSLQTERIAGGTRVTLPEFGLTSAVLFTSNLGPEGMIARLQELARHSRKQAAQWAHDLAEVEIDKVGRVEAQLERAGHILPDGRQLLENARARLRTSVEHYNNGAYSDCYHEAERALRPLRILMRAQWEQAVRPLDTPVASPYAVSYFTLPRHWAFIEQFKRGTAGKNVLPAGDFEVSPDRLVDAWSQQTAVLDDVDVEARRVSHLKKEGKQSLMLSILPKDPKLPEPHALERSFVAINSPAVKLPPGTPVQISGWVYLAGNVRASADGALLYDSAGGEPLAVRLTASTVWKKFTLYREVPASGEINVTLALTGFGYALFDDIRIEPLPAGGSATSVRAGNR